MALRARWVVSWLTLIADGLGLDRYVSRTGYGVGVYNTLFFTFSYLLLVNC